MSIYTLKNHLKSQVLLDRELMEPGFYIVGTQTAHRVNSPIPALLKSVKSQDFNLSGQPLRRRIIGAFRLSVPPPFVYMRKSPAQLRNSSSRMTHMLRTFEGNIKLFSTEDSLVLTAYRNANDFKVAATAHANLSKYLPIIPTRFSPSEKISREPLLTGSHLNVANSNKVIEVMSEYACRNRSYAATCPDKILSLEDATEIVQTVVQAVPEYLAREVLASGYEPIIDLLTGAPLIPVHLDAKPENIIYNDNNWTLIDYDLSTSSIYFYDIFYLIAAFKYYHDDSTYFESAKKGAVADILDNLLAFSYGVDHYRSNPGKFWSAFFMMHSYHRITRPFPNPITRVKTAWDFLKPLIHR